MGCFCKKVRTLHCKVVLLDEQELVQEIQVSQPPQHVPNWKQRFKAYVLKFNVVP